MPGVQGSLKVLSFSRFVCAAEVLVCQRGLGVNVINGWIGYSTQQKWLQVIRDEPVRQMDYPIQFGSARRNQGLAKVFIASEGSLTTALYF